MQVSGLEGLEELNRAFQAWLEVSYHTRPHSETRETPLERFAKGLEIRRPDPKLMYEAFCWYAERSVTKTAQVSLEGNRYDVDPHLVARKVTLRFDPFDLSRIEVLFRKESFGYATPSQLKRFAHPALVEPEPAGGPTGIDYLKLLVGEHERSLNKLIPYRELEENEEEENV